MALPNDKEMQKAAEDFKANFTNGTVKIKSSTETLASHTITDIQISNSGSNKAVTITTNTAIVTNSGGNPAITVELVSLDTLKVYTMSSTEVVFSNDAFTDGLTSEVTSFVMYLKP